MKGYVAGALAAAIPVLAVVGVIVFLLIHITPGDPAAVMAGPNATPEQVASLRTALGLNRPLAAQFAGWASRVASGDLGRSFFLNMPVTAAIAQRLEPTLLLTVGASAVAVALGVGAGIVAGTRPNTRLDAGVMALAACGLSIPSFWLAMNLILLFGVRLRVLPVAGYVPLAENPIGTLRSLLLPVLSLGAVESALIARMARATLLEVLGQEYVRTARAKGLPGRLVVLRHALKNALLPVVTVIGNTFAGLLGGVIVTETVFNIPGFGRLIIQAVLNRDYPVVQGTVLCVAVAYVAVNLAVDAAYAWIDPRLKYG